MQITETNGWEMAKKKVIFKNSDFNDSINREPLKWISSSHTF